MRQQADWDEQWRAEPSRPEAIAEEARSPRWAAQERVVYERFGGFAGLRVIEVGAGRGTTAALYAQRGSEVVLFDSSPVALEQAQALFDGLSLRAEYVLGDAFELPESLLGSFDVAMSFGLCEHFVGEQRTSILAAHLALLGPPGFALVSVPNRWSPLYRAWMGAQKMRGTWQLGTEAPFSASELRRLCGAAGGEVITTCHGSFLGSVIGHNLNELIAKAGVRSSARVPQWSTPLLDRLAYDLSVAFQRS